jgi:hypothetical protein
MQRTVIAELASLSAGSADAADAEWLSILKDFAGINGFMLAGKSSTIPALRSNFSKEAARVNFNSANLYPNEISTSLHRLRPDHAMRSALSRTD